MTSVSASWAQASPVLTGIVEELRQQEQVEALRRSQQKSADTRLPTGAITSTKRLPKHESPCFHIDHLVLIGDKAQNFQWILDAASSPHGLNGADDSPIGRCLGTESINIVMERLQQIILKNGWITTRVLVGPQDLRKGTLTLTLVPGRVAAIRFAPGSTPASPRLLASAVPVRPGDLLNLRDIEQGLDNLRRLPSTSASIRIEPATDADGRPGYSDLVITWQRKFPLRGTVNMDDSGTNATGKRQGGITLAWDGPLGLNDLLYLNLSHDLFNRSGRGNNSQTLSYSIPWRKWLLGFSIWRSSYRQSVTGLTQKYTYGGTSTNGELTISRLVHRSQHGITSARVGIFRRSSHSSIDDVEIPVQRQTEAGWEIGISHKEFVGTASFRGDLTYRRGTGIFGARPHPGQAFGAGTSRVRIFTAVLDASVPFRLGQQSLRYQGLLRAQWNQSPLVAQDGFAIGGRYTVRGFDGQNILLGDRGWLLRNDLSWALGTSGAAAYLGMDYGQVGGQLAEHMDGTHLMGAVLGVRGGLSSVPKLNYDLFMGTPIHKPHGFRTASVTAGFNLHYSF